jgi:hypothetical protein
MSFIIFTKNDMMGRVCSILGRDYGRAVLKRILGNGM